MFIEDVVQRIGYIRYKANLSARELSIAIGKSPSYINRLETSFFEISLSTLFEILRVCNVSVEEFFSNDFPNYKSNLGLQAKIEKLNERQKEKIVAIIDEFR